MHLPSLVAFYDMQENTTVQFCHPETAGEPPLSPIYILHTEYSRGAMTSEYMDEKRFGSYQSA